jgi:dTDP-4-amino-4,6-dideoxygalactose transaminase
LKIPISNGSNDHAYHLFPLQIKFEKLFLTKLEIFKKMKNTGINLQVHYIPVHLQPFYKKKYGFEQGDFPVSENFYRNEVSLPIYPDLTTDDVSLVVSNIMEIISK